MRHLLSGLVIATAVATAGATAGLAGDMPVMTGETELGTVFTDKKGMTLYTFTKDEPGKSNCYDQCAKAWPPLLAEDKAMEGEGFTIIQRDDGMSQWAYKGMPLYGWVKDEKPGDVTGHGFKDVWLVAKP